MPISHMQKKKKKKEQQYARHAQLLQTFCDSGNWSNLDVNTLRNFYSRSITFNINSVSGWRKHVTFPEWFQLQT